MLFEMNLLSKYNEQLKSFQCLVDGTSNLKENCQNGKLSTLAPNEELTRIQTVFNEKFKEEFDLNMRKR